MVRGYCLLTLQLTTDHLENVERGPFAWSGQGGIERRGAASTAGPTNFWKKNLTSLSLKIRNLELPDPFGNGLVNSVSQPC